MVATTREQWLEERRGTIGASEWATALNVNPWGSPLQLALRMRGDLPPLEQTEPMEWGHRLEGEIANKYEDETGRKTVDLGEFTIQRNPDYPFLHATLDREVRPCKDHDMPGDLQCKNVGAHMAKEWVEDIPPYVEVQIQGELCVTGMTWGSAAALIGGQRFLWKDVERNQRFIDWALPKLEAFHEIVFSGGDLPEAGPQDADALRILYPEPEEGKVIELPERAEELTTLVDELQEKLGAHKPIAEQLMAAQNKIKQLLGNAERGVLADGSGWSYKLRAGYTPKSVQPTRILRRVKA
jgi:putative phage-type endonuclease